MVVIFFKRTCIFFTLLVSFFLCAKFSKYTEFSHLTSMHFIILWEVTLSNHKWCLSYLKFGVLRRQGMFSKHRLKPIKLAYTILSTPYFIRPAVWNIYSLKTRNEWKTLWLNSLLVEHGHSSSKNPTNCPCAWQDIPFREADNLNCVAAPNLCKGLELPWLGKKWFLRRLQSLL